MSHTPMAIRFNEQFSHTVKFMEVIHLILRLAGITFMRLKNSEEVIES